MSEDSEGVILELDSIKIDSNDGFIEVSTGLSANRILEQISDEEIFKYLTNRRIYEKERRFSRHPSDLEIKINNFIEQVK